MFSCDTVASAEALKRAQQLRDGSAAAAWAQVKTPTHDSIAASLRRRPAAQAGDAALRAVLPPPRLLAAPEEVRRAYPDPPPYALVNAGGSGTGAPARPSAAERDRKRKRAEAEARLVAGSDAAAAAGPSPSLPAAAGDPTCVFEEGYETVDHMGRSFVEPPPALVQSAAAATARPCSPPQALRGLFRQPTAGASGVQLVRWSAPAYGHLLFAANLKGEARLWEAHGSRRPVATFAAHTQPVKSLEVTSDGAVMSTGSVDGTAVLWDVETGACRAVLTNPEGQQVVQHCHHPSAEHALVLAAVDRRVALYDTRVSHAKCQREYTGHMGSIFNLTLLSGGAKFLTTAEDRTLRTWDFRVPVQIKQFADANMHAITHVAHHPTEDFLAAQSLDNRIIIFHDDGAGKLRVARNKEFTGHTTSGTRCQVGFSRDGQYLSSGDIEGGLYVWRWATGELVRTFKAHSQMLVAHQWHPLEPSRIVTGAWDGHIKNWA